MIERAWVEIDTGALRSNAMALANLVAPRTLIAPVVKANAYGHGLVECSRALEDLPGVWGFCVARAEEAITLREAGIKKPVLVLGPPPAEEIVEVARRHIILGVGSKEDVQAVAKGLKGTALGLEVHLKVDTGMSRMGVEVENVASVAKGLSCCLPLRLTGVYSHFATAEAPDLDFAQRQLQRFEAALATLNGYKLLRHIANSAALVRLPRARFDLVRPGAVLYGLNPGIPAGDLPALRPVLRLVAQVSELKRLPAGCAVGYGLTYQLKRKSTIALVPVGYGDGYPRSLAGKGEVLIRGQRAMICGAVNMDSVTVDVTALPLPVRPGDEVVLIGEQGADRITIEELATRGGTIVHEIPTRLGPRLPRLYV
ncbi:MAG: alanine racemase [Candidatus Zipacnadales bacterium]